MAVNKLYPTVKIHNSILTKTAKAQNTKKLRYTSTTYNTRRQKTRLLLSHAHVTNVATLNLCEKIELFIINIITVSYTHLTLPTKRIV